MIMSEDRVRQWASAQVHDPGILVRLRRWSSLSTAVKEFSGSLASVRLKVQEI